MITLIVAFFGFWGDTSWRCAAKVPSASLANGGGIDARGFLFGL